MNISSNHTPLIFEPPLLFFSSSFSLYSSNFVISSYVNSFANITYWSFDLSSTIVVNWSLERKSKLSRRAAIVASKKSLSSPESINFTSNIKL